MRMKRRILQRTLATVLLAAGLTAMTATQAFALTELELAGASRFETAVEISQAGWSTGSANAVIIATGRNWPDALGGAVLCGGDMLDGPLLLVEQDSIPDVVWNEISRLGASEAVILGGPSAVGSVVEDRLNTELGASNVTRLQGANRYATANAIAAHAIEVDNANGLPYDGTAFVATGGDFPDSLAVSPYSMSGEWPLFLADPVADTVPDAYMSSLGVTNVYILGGVSAVSVNQEAALVAEFGAENVTRLWGLNRYSTGTAIAQYAYENWFHDWNWCSFATGEKFPDALAGGTLAGKWGSVLLITPSDSLHSSVESKLETYKAGIDHVQFMGGTNALSDTVRAEVRSILP